MSAEVVVVGLSHRTASVEVRERLAFGGDELLPALQSLRQLPGIGEVMLVSTCNRVEVYAGTAERAAAMAVPAAEAIRRYLAGARRVDAETLAGHLYEHTGRAAVHHLFRVASALDSLVIGESQIAGQLKDAYGVAARAGSIGPLLGRCFEKAMAVAKRVRTETAIARGGANVSSVAVELAKRIFGDLDGRQVLVVGAGEMADLAARHLRSDGASEILVTNRSAERAEALARRVEGRARPFAELEGLLGTADVVLASTGSPAPLITLELMRSVIRTRRGRPVFLIDIAVPRDVEAAVASLDGVYVFDLDDLEQVVADNLKERRAEAIRAERIVETETTRFAGWLSSQGVVPTIRDLRERFHAVADAEVEKALAGRHDRLGPEAEEALRRLADSIVNKLLHSPLTALKAPETSAGETLAEAARRLFALPERRAAKETTLDAEVAERSGAKDEGAPVTGASSAAHEP